MDPKLGNIIILNGAPRSGKSSICQVIQNSFEGLWINLGVDQVMQMTPPRYQPGIGLRPGGERPDLEPVVCQLYLALYESIAAHSRLGINVVVDVGHHDVYQSLHGLIGQCMLRIVSLPVVVVGIYCSLDCIMSRRLATGYNHYNSDGSIPLPIQRWQKAVHHPGIYDLTVDTSLLSAEVCAHEINQYLMAKPALLACQQLVALYQKGAVD